MNRIKQHVATGLFCIAGMLLSGCIKNDVPYPHVEGQITAMEAEGIVISEGIATTEINTNNRTVVLMVADTIDLSKVRITKLAITPDASVYPDADFCLNVATFPQKGFVALDSIPEDADTRVNFGKPVSFLIKTYQEYLWTVTVKRDIHRVIQISKQFGEPIIDEKTKQVIVYVDKSQSLQNIEILKLRLGSSIATTIPDPATVKDFTRPIQFEVSAFGQTDLWTVSVLYAEGTSTSGMSVWAKKVYLTAGKLAGSTDTPGFQYRKKADPDWITVLQGDIEISATSFSTWLKGLTPATDYIYRTVLGSVVGEGQSFKTEAAPTIANLSFEDWILDVKGKCWYPNADGANSFWASGNEGVTISVVNKPSNTAPTDDGVKGKAAMLASIKVPLVNFAAGNIFTGTYKTNLSDPRSSAVFGREFKGRPSRLKGYYKYTGGVIDVCDNKNLMKDKLGQPDQFNIYIRLEDRSRLGQPIIIASAELRGSETKIAYTPFDLELKYKDEQMQPTHIVLVATSSIYGDDFTGHTGSLLYVDEFELSYE